MVDVTLINPANNDTPVGLLLSWTMGKAPHFQVHPRTPLWGRRSSDQKEALKERTNSVHPFFPICETGAAPGLG